MRLVRGMTMTAALVAISAGSAIAGFTTPVQNGVPSNSARGVGAGVVGTGNGSFTYNHAGPDFVPGIVNITGTLVSVDPGTWSNEARVEICNPSVCVFTGALPGTAGTTFTSLNINANINSNGLLTGTSVGVWTFEFFESYNDPGNPDSLWNDLTITINDATPPDVGENINLGALNNDGSTLKVNGDLLSNGITDRYTFTLPYGVSNLADYLNIRTTGMDTELGLYDGGGNYIADDDDGNGGFPPGHSMLSFGAADPWAGGVNQVAPGFHGLALPAGTYTVVVGGWNTVFGATLNDITGGTTQGNYSLSLNYVPEPATLTLLALGAIGFIRRRR